MNADVYVDDGLLTLDLDVSSHCVLSLIFYDDGSIGYAGLVGTQSAFGRFGTAAPEVLRELLRGFIKKDIAS